MSSLPQDTVACSCPACGNLFAVKTSFLGRQVRCPVCSSIITAARDVKQPETVSKARQDKETTPSGPETEEEKHPRPPVSEYLPSPQKKTDVRNIPRSRKAPSAPERNTTKSASVGNGKKNPRPSPRQAPPPWRKNCPNTIPPQAELPGRSAKPPGISGCLSPDWFSPFWASSCSSEVMTWRRKTARF